MLGRSIYEDYRHDISNEATSHAQLIRLRLEGEKNLQKAIKSAQSIANDYHVAVIPTIYEGLREIGHNAATYYAPDLDEIEIHQVVTRGMDELIGRKYHGLTLPQRLVHSNVVLRSNIRKSGSVGKQMEERLENIARAFTHPYPFGAHENWDKRILLAESVRLEHFIAKDIAVIKSHRLIRWTLSDYHSRDDVCDHLAANVDDRVLKLIADQNWDLDPKGVYFVHRAPKIPHPNCQCVLKFIYDKRERPKKRPNLVQRIINFVFNR